MNPGILFLDEPTTGLDASAALAVMTTVRELAQRISVICTIHQVWFRVAHRVCLRAMELGLNYRGKIR